MSRRGPRVAAIALACGAPAWVAALVGCSLGLDESKLDDVAVPPGAPDATSAPGEAGSDGGMANPPRGDGQGPGAEATPACARDVDCVASNKCLRGRCDLATGTCLYDQCPQSTACASAGCDVAAATCALPVTHGFRAATFPVARGAVACGGSVSRCFAAVYPFVFVGTVNGVVAYSVADVATSAPPPVSVSGLPFLPQFVVASGRRVYFVGPPAPAQPDFRLAIAWIDVPGDPLTRALTARSLFASYPHNAISSVLAAAGAGIFVVHGDGSRLYPTGIVRAPIRDFATIATYPLAGIPNGAFPAVASGARLLSYRYDGAQGVFAPQFAFQIGPGTPTSQSANEQSGSALGFLGNQPSFAQGTDGSVLFSAPALAVGDAGVEVPAVRLTWLVADATATAIDTSVRIDVQTYAPAAPPGAQFVGPIAWIDSKRALVTSALREDRNQTVIQVASRAVTPAGILPNRRVVLAASPGSIAAAASEGTGFVLAPDGPENLSVHVFAPTCPP